MKITSIAQARKKKSQKLLDEGCSLVYGGFVDQAYKKFDQSYKLNQSADALTYKGWMLHIKGDLQGALKLCQQAIKLDPDFGNPYNDIGTILVSQRKFNDAISWFKKAIKAKRYEPRQFPHINLAKIYFEMDKPDLALTESKEALKFDPENPYLQINIKNLEQEISKRQAFH